jgi:hypothetical protein
MAFGKKSALGRSTLGAQRHTRAEGEPGLMAATPAQLAEAVAHVQKGGSARGAAAATIAEFKEKGVNVPKSSLYRLVAQSGDKLPRRSVGRPPRLQDRFVDFITILISHGMTRAHTLPTLLCRKLMRMLLIIQDGSVALADASLGVAFGQANEDASDDEEGDIFNDSLLEHESDEDEDDGDGDDDDGDLPKDDDTGGCTDTFAWLHRLYGPHH